jgi:IMP dehydrogenase
MKVSNIVQLTFDDVLIEPGFSDIVTRDHIDLSSDILGVRFLVPIISSNMDYVTERRMAQAMFNAGGAGILHRFYDWEKQKDDIIDLWGQHKPAWFCVGTRDRYDSLKKIKEIDVHTGPGVVCVDVAHGHHEKVYNLVVVIKERFPEWKVIAGNVATEDGAYFLAEAGADAIKVGIGPGSACTTRVVTGAGVPQLSAIMNCADAVRHKKTTIIADGGIRNSGDIVKALAAGAHAVMLGNLLAGASESPGEVIQTGDGRRLRPYRGQSIFGRNGDNFAKEGVSGFVEEKGPVAGIIQQLAGGIRSGMSYVGARNLEELREKTKFLVVSSSTLAENLPRIAQAV